MATHNNPQGNSIDIAKFTQSTTPHVAAGPWQITMGNVTNGVDFMMVPGTVQGTSQTLKNILEVKGNITQSFPSYTVTDRSKGNLLWTKALLSLAVCTRGGGNHYIGLANLDTPGNIPESTLNQLGKTIANVSSNPGNVWITLIRDASTTPAPFNPGLYYYYFQQGYGPNQKLPDNNKNDIVGTRGHAAVHFQGYVGELTDSQIMMFKQFPNQIGLDGIEQTMIGGYYNKNVALFRILTI